MTKARKREMHLNLKQAVLDAELVVRLPRYHNSFGGGMFKLVVAK